MMLNQTSRDRSILGKTGNFETFLQHLLNTGMASASALSLDLTAASLTPTKRLAHGRAHIGGARRDDGASSV